MRRQRGTLQGKASCANRMALKTIVARAFNDGAVAQRAELAELSLRRGRSPSSQAGNHRT
jgi:hypothetical protein